MWKLPSSSTTLVIILACFYSGQQIACLPQQQLQVEDAQQQPTINQTASSSNASALQDDLSPGGDNKTLMTSASSTLAHDALNLTSDASTPGHNKSVEPSLAKSVTDTEVADLVKPLITQATPSNETRHTDEDLARMVFTNDTFNKNIMPAGKDNEDVGYIQTSGNEDDEHVADVEEESEDGGHYDPLLSQQVILDQLEEDVKPAVNASQIPAIVAGIFVVLCIVGYSAMLMWRRFLEKRYGNREMLVNEDFSYDPNDLHHFSL